MQATWKYSKKSCSELSDCDVALHKILFCRLHCGKSVCIFLRWPIKPLKYQKKATNLLHMTIKNLLIQARRGKFESTIKKQGKNNIINFWFGEYRLKDWRLFSNPSWSVIFEGKSHLLGKGPACGCFMMCQAGISSWQKRRINRALDYRYNRIGFPMVPAPAGY